MTVQKQDFVMGSPVSPVVANMYGSNRRDGHQHKSRSTLSVETVWFIIERNAVDIIHPSIIHIRLVGYFGHSQG